MAHRTGSPGDPAGHGAAARAPQRTGARRRRACLPEARVRPTYRGRVTITTGTDGTPLLEVESEPTTRSTQPPAAGAPFVVTAPAASTPGLVARARTDGVTGPAVALLSALLVLGGALLDLRRDATPGLGTGLAVAIVAIAAPAVVRFRSLLTAAVLPPLLVTAATALIARLSGNNRGLRELVLDVGTTLALSAPLLFGATALALLVVLVRLVRRLVTR